MLGGLHTVIVGSGEVFPDALAAGPLAARERLPILLTGRDHLPAATAAALDGCNICEQALIMGGPAAVAPTVEAELRPPGWRSHAVTPIPMPSPPLLSARWRRHLFC
jgi:putative cell wall-binding protein